MPPRKRKLDQSVEDDSKQIKDDSSVVEWTSHGDPLEKGLQPLLFRRDPKCRNSAIVYAFDIDDTIIVPKSGARFGKGPADWKWLFGSVPDTLRKLHNEEKAKVVFFTNQAGVEKGHTMKQDLMKKFDDVVSQINVPINVYISTGNNHFRKPSREMWDFMEVNHNAGVKLDLSKCVYVGDAAGRPKDWKPGCKKDFSCSDRQFAANIGCLFYTPEEFFLKESPFTHFDWRSFNSKEALAMFKTDYDQSYHKTTQEVVLLCGPPASGKSTFFKRKFLPHGYVHVNRDTLGTEAKCVKALEAALKENKSVVVDNTNPSKESRAQFVSIAEATDVPIRCMYLDTPMELSKHLNFVRQNDTKGKVRRIPDVAYNMYKSKFQEPSESEGFQQVLKVSFHPVFDEHANEKLFYQWTEG